MSSGSGLTVLILPSAAAAMTTRETTDDIPVTGVMNIQGAVLRQSTGKKGLENSATALSVTGAATRMKLKGYGETGSGRIVVNFDGEPFHMTPQQDYIDSDYCTIDEKKII